MISKPHDVIDRDREWAALAKRAVSARMELVFVLGPRRVGKSFLLAPFARHFGGIYYQGTRRTEAEQRGALTRLIGRHFDDAALKSGAVFADWDGLFAHIAERARDAPLTLVLDEYPYMEDASPGLGSVVQRWLDHEWRATQLKLVLCGSHVSAMKRLEERDQPLYGRRTARVEVRPFDVFDAARFVPRYTARDRLRVWGTFGALPGHLALIDPQVDLASNIIDHILDPGARLHDEGERQLDTFVRDPGLHYAIMGAIAAGEHTWKGICSRVGKSSGSLSRPLRWLIDMGIVERRAPITEPDPAASRRARYRLTDPYPVFWLRHVSPLRVTGRSSVASPASIWAEDIAPRLDDHMGPIFEAAVRDFVARGFGVPFPVARVGGWWEGDDEIDVVALSTHGDVFAAECKWGPVRHAHFETLRRRAARLAARLDRVGRVHLAVFTARPDPSDSSASADDIRVLTAEEMFEISAGRDGGH